MNERMKGVKGWRDGVLGSRVLHPPHLTHEVLPLAWASVSPCKKLESPLLSGEGVGHQADSFHPTPIGEVQTRLGSNPRPSHLLEF